MYGSQISQGQLNRKLNIEDVKEKRESIFLSLLQRKGSLYGWEFKKYVQREFGVNLSASEYHPMVNGLEEEGIIRSESVIVNGRNRRVFHPIPFKTTEYLENLRNTNNRNTAKMNKISRGSLSLGLIESVSEKAEQ